MEPCMGLFHFPTLSPEREALFKRTKVVRLTLAFAISSIVLGFASAVLQVANLSTKTYAPSNYLCFGIWCGFLYILAGSLTVDAIVFHNIKSRMSLATLTSGLALIFSTLATVWSIQDRLYLHDISHSSHGFESANMSQSNEQCLREWMKTFQVTIHISLVIGSSLAVISNMVIFLVQASKMLNSKNSPDQRTFDQLFALPQLSMISKPSRGKNLEKQCLLSDSRYSRNGYTYL